MLRRCLPALLVLLASPGASADDRASCIAAADRGQDLRDQRKLTDAREQFVACARDACPAAVRKDCIQWQSDVESRIPTVVLVVRDDRGNDLSLVRALLDGKVIAEKIDGTSMNVDPGEHTFAFESAGQRPSSVHVVVREGEKNRQVAVVLAPERASGPLAGRNDGSAKASPLAPAIAVGATGVVVLGVSLALGLTGRSDVAHLRETCAGHCAQSDVDAARRKLLFADIGIGIGVIALGVAAYLAWTRKPAAAYTASFR